MPLILMCGLPRSGKSTVAGLIKEKLVSTGKQVIVHSEDSLGLKRENIYVNSTAEKQARAQLKAAVERDLTADTFVILDWLNFIKGYRYELYCVARAASTASCVVYCEADDQLCTQRNESAYPADVFNDLLGRLEIPNDRQRWDRPLYIVTSRRMIGSAPAAENAHAPAAVSVKKPTTFLRKKKIADKETLPAQQSWIDKKMDGAIHHSLGLDGRELTAHCTSTHRENDVEVSVTWNFDTNEMIEYLCCKASAASKSLATITVRGSYGNLRHELDKMLKDIMDEVMSHQQNFVPGEEIRVPHATKAVVLERRTTFPELSQWKRQFLKICELRKPSEDQIGNSFVDYINNAIVE